MPFGCQYHISLAFKIFTSSEGTKWMLLIISCLFVWVGWDVCVSMQS